MYSIPLSTKPPLKLPSSLWIVLGREAQYFLFVPLLCVSQIIYSCSAVTHYTIFRCVLASLQEGVSVRPFVGRSVTDELKSCKSAVFDQNYRQYERERILCRVSGLVFLITRYQTGTIQ